MEGKTKIVKNNALFIKPLIFLYPLWWMLGLDPVIFHVGSLIYFARIFYLRGMKLKIPIEGYFFLSFILLYFFSLSYNLPFNTIGKGLASAFNLSFWIMGLLLMISVYNDNSFDEEVILKPLVILNLIILAISIFSLGVFYFMGVDNLKIHSFLSVLLPKLGKIPVLKDYFARLLIFRSGGFYGVSFPRMSVLFPYPFSLSLFLVLSLPLVSFWFWKRGQKTMSIASSIAGAGVLFLSLSRFPFLSYVFVLSTMWIAILLKWERRKIKMKLFLFLLSYSLILLLPIGIKVLKWLFLNLRPNSAISRISSYKYALELVMSRPLFGIGVKTRIPGLSIPVGTHCTYLEVFLKTGVFGGFFFVLSFLVIYFRLFSLYKKGIKEKILFYGASITLVLLWMVVGNIDYLPLPTFIFFSIWGIIVRESKRTGEYEERD